MVQSLVGAVICILRTMREEIPTLTLVVTRTAAVPIVTIISGLDHDTGIISAQMSWKFIMKCLLKTGWQQRNEQTNSNQQQPQQKHQQTNKNKRQQKINKQVNK